VLQVGSQHGIEGLDVVPQCQPAIQRAPCCRVVVLASEEDYRRRRNCYRGREIRAGAIRMLWFGRGSTRQAQAQVLRALPVADQIETTAVPTHVLTAVASFPSVGAVGKVRSDGMAMILGARESTLPLTACQAARSVASFGAPPSF
jgi:hypothetical protein